MDITVGDSSQIVEGLVTTIIPVYNRPEMLRQAMESVLAQTWQSIEIIIGDDGSTDATPEVARQYESDYPNVVRYLWNPHRGAGLAREAGRQRARGEFIQYLDSDDTLWPRKFEVQIKALRQRPDCGAAYGFIRLCPEGQKPKEKPHKWSGRALPTLFPWLLVDRWWNTDSPLWRRSVCNAIGPWSDLRFSQDWEYDARAGGLGTRLAHCAEFVCDQHLHEETRQTGSGKWLSPSDRVRFLTTLFDSGTKAGVEHTAPEMQHFVRWVFKNVRECGILGDGKAASDLMALAVKANRRTTMEMRLYQLLARAAGWEHAARIVERSRSLLGRRAGRHTHDLSHRSR